MDWITICITGKRLADSGFFFGGGGWGEEYSPKFYTGRLRPEVQPLTLLYSIFDRNDSPFVYFPLTNGSTPLTYLGYNLLKITVLSNKYITKRHVKRYKKQNSTLTNC